MTTVSLALETIARDTPDRLAVLDRGTPINFATLAGRVRRAAASLRRAGLAPGDLVGLSVREELPRLVLQLGLMRLGCTSVTLASFEPLEAREALARRCGAVAVVTDVDIAQPAGLSVVKPDLAAISADATLEAEGRVLPHPDGAVPAVVLTSSGTTGLPKLILRTQAQLLAYDQPEWPPRSLSRSTIASPAEANAWTWINLGNLARRCALVFLDPAAQPFEQACSAHGVTRASIWPAALPELIDACSRTPGGSPMRDVCVLTGGTAVGPELQRAVRAHITERLLVLYGATEVGNATWLLADPDRHPVGAVGRPMPGVEIGIFDPDGRAMPRGETGFVRIRCPWMATEYWRDEAATARAFVDGWWLPGDLGSLAPDGMLVFAGRGDDMMVMNSINIFPAEIERAAVGFPGVRECAAFPVPMARYGQIPVLAVVADPGFDAEALLAHCRAQLGVRAPRKVVQVEQLPRNATGKVLRRTLEARYRQD